MFELTVILKDEERSYRQKFLVYDEVKMHHDDPFIWKCITEAKKNFSGEPGEIRIKISMEIK